MNLFERQMTMEDNEVYREFVNKFKPKKTTDDCYTPPEIHEVVMRWVEERYGIGREHFLRPFFPGGDYLNAEYPDGCCVVDNPPFSIITQIIADYVDSGIKFFLYSPYLTNFSSDNNIRKITHIITSSHITYENGARINTSFITNLTPDLVAEAEPKLGRLINDTDRRLRLQKKPELPHYEYPPNVLTAAMLGYMAHHGVAYSVKRDSAFFVRGLESQRSSGKTIFGGGFLISDSAAAEKELATAQAAINAETRKEREGTTVAWSVSERERAIIDELDLD